MKIYGILHAVLAMLNLYCFIIIGVVKEAVMGKGSVKVLETMSMHILLCGV